MSGIRLFIAIPLPEVLKQEIQKMTKGLSIQSSWIPEENWHVTVHFIGHVEEDELAKIKEKLESEVRKFSSFILQPKRLVQVKGRFRNMLWVKFQKSQAFEIISRDLALSLGKEMKSAPLPHITLSRLKEKQPIENLPVEIGKDMSWEVKSVELWQSKLSPYGACYSPKGVFYLKS